MEGGPQVLFCVFSQRASSSSPLIFRILVFYLRLGYIGLSVLSQIYFLITDPLFIGSYNPVGFIPTGPNTFGATLPLLNLT